jgi:hypothetical protein
METKFVHFSIVSKKKIKILDQLFWEILTFQQEASFRVWLGQFSTATEIVMDGAG